VEQKLLKLFSQHSDRDHDGRTMRATHHAAIDPIFIHYIITLKPKSRKSPYDPFSLVEEGTDAIIMEQR
jgi:hypothetical protein